MICDNCKQEMEVGYLKTEQGFVCFTKDVSDKVDKLNLPLIKVCRCPICHTIKVK